MRTLLVVVAVALALAVAACAWFYTRGDVSSARAHRMVEDGALLVDVRSPEEYADGHLPGARNVPVDDLDRRLPELEPKDRPVVVYCRSGRRSARAAAALRAAGFRVADLGPMSRW